MANKSLKSIARDANSGVVKASGEKSIGDTYTTGTGTGPAIQLTTTKTPCAFVIVGAPTADNAEGANTGTLYVYAVPPGVANTAPTHIVALANGRPVATTQYEGVRIYTNDASRVWVAAKNAADGAKWQAIG